MKAQKIITLFAFTVFTFLLTTSCDKEKEISGNEISNEIQSYISTHFADHTVQRVIQDRDGLSVTYEVYLEGNLKLEFNKNNEIIDIENLTKLPDSVIPEKIRQYVSENYPDNFIKGWELDDKHQQIELDNGLDLEFDMNGNFLRIDD